MNDRNYFDYVVLMYEVKIIENGLLEIFMLVIFDLDGNIYFGVIVFDIDKVLVEKIYYIMVYIWLLDECMVVV